MSMYPPKRRESKSTLPAARSPKSDVLKEKDETIAKLEKLIEQYETKMNLQLNSSSSDSRFDELTSKISNLENDYKELEAKRELLNQENISLKMRIVELLATETIHNESLKLPLGDDDIDKEHNDSKVEDIFIRRVMSWRLRSGIGGYKNWKGGNPKSPSVISKRTLSGIHNSNQSINITTVYGGSRTPPKTISTFPLIEPGKSNLVDALPCTPTRAILEPSQIMSKRSPPSTATAQSNGNDINGNQSSISNAVKSSVRSEPQVMTQRRSATPRRARGPKGGRQVLGSDTDDDFNYELDDEQSDSTDDSGFGNSGLDLRRGKGRRRERGQVSDPEVPGREGKEGGEEDPQRGEEAHYSSTENPDVWRVPQNPSSPPNSSALAALAVGDEDLVRSLRTLQHQADELYNQVLSDLTALKQDLSRPTPPLLPRLQAQQSNARYLLTPASSTLPPSPPR